MYGPYATICKRLRGIIYAFFVRTLFLNEILCYFTAVVTNDVSKNIRFSSTTLNSSCAMHQHVHNVQRVI